MSGYDASAVGRVVVGVSGSLGSVTALRRAGALARRLGAELWPVLAWEPPGGDPATRRSAAAAVPDDEWQRLAGGRLVAVLEEIFGDGGPGCRSTPSSCAAPRPRAGGDRGPRGRSAGRGRGPTGPAARLLRPGPPALPRPRRLPGARRTAVPAGVPLLAVHRRNAWHLPMDTRGL